MSDGRFDIRAARQRLTELRGEATVLERSISKAMHERLRDLTVTLHDAQQIETLLADVRDFLSDERG
jgi:hypothetical protein